MGTKTLLISLRAEPFLILTITMFLPLLINISAINIWANRNAGGVSF